MDKLHYVALHAHSGWRWIVLILLLFAVVKMHRGWKKDKQYTEGDRKLALFAMIAYHIQFLVGWALFFISPKVNFGSSMMGHDMLRFFTMEHSVMMLLAFILITIGHSKSKKKDTDKQKFRMIAIFYTLALVIVLVAIPWPFREALNASWF